MAASASHTIRNVVGGLCVGIGLGYPMITDVDVPRWVHEAPRVAEAARGLTFPHNEHGGIVYFSAAQTLADNLHFWLLLLFFLGLFIAPKKNVRRRFLGANWDRDDPSNIGLTTTILTLAAVAAGMWFAWPAIMDFLLACGVPSGAGS